jgi:hypothetical protein
MKCMAILAFVGLIHTPPIGSFLGFWGTAAWLGDGRSLRLMMTATRELEEDDE